MKNIKSKKQVLYFICIVIFIALCALMSTNWLQPAYAQTMDESIANLTENQYEITNTDKPNNIPIKNYAEKYYGKNASLSWDHSVWLGDKVITVSSDDDIVKLIPKNLFQTVGIVQHIGLKYGFFIETKKPFDNNDMLLSTVMIIAVNVENDMMSANAVSHLKIKLTPIFQADFAYVEKGNEKIYSIYFQDHDFFTEEYNNDLVVEYPADGDGFVIPLPTAYVASGGAHIDFLQHNKYYLTNASNVTSLYNVNQKNPYDEGYVAQQDMGCFFSQLDFNYSGFFLEQGKTNANEVGTVAYNAASLALDVYDSVKGFKSVFKAIPFLGQAITFADIANNIGSIVEELKDYKITDQKNITYEPYFNNKDQQIARGGLRKDAAIAVKSSTEKQLLFGTNNYFEFDYQINCQDITVDTRYATMLNIGVMSVISKGSNTRFGEIHEFTSAFSDELRNNPDRTYKEIPNVEISGLGTKSDVQILPNSNGYAQLSPAFSGNYKITLNNQFSKFSIYEVTKLSNGILNYQDTSNAIGTSQKVNGVAILDNVYLNSNKFYLLIADLKDNFDSDKIYGRYGIVSMDAELIKKNVTLGANTIEVNSAQEYLEFDSTMHNNYRFTLSNANSILHLLNSNFEIVQTSENGELLSVLNKNETYYLRIDRSDSTETTVGLKIKDEMYVHFENIQGITNPIDETITVSLNDTVTLLVPEKRGYTFDGWWTDLGKYCENVTNQNIFDYIQPELNLYAKWTPIHYTIFYEENGGERIPDGDYIVEHKVTLNQNVTKPGYVFCGWYDNPSLGGAEIKSFPAGNIGNKTFYAKWVKDTFQINLNVNDTYTDGVAATIKVTTQDVAYRQHYVLPVPVLDGFIFQGWYHDSEKFTDNKGTSLNVYTVEGDIALTAKWSREKYYIRINSNGTFRWFTKEGDDFAFSADKTYVENEIGLCPNCYIESEIAKGGTFGKQIQDYLFKEGNRYLRMIKNPSDPSSLACWKNGELGAEFQDNDTIEIYAYYEIELQFKIYIDSGNQNYSKIIYTDFGKPIDYAPIPSKEGYTFDYFIVSTIEPRNNVYKNTQFNPGNRFEYANMPDLSVGIERDGDAIYLTPIFKANDYKVTLISDGKSLIVKTVTFGKAYNTSSENAFLVPTKTGYDFQGWYTGENGKGTQKTDKEGNTLQGWDIANDCSLYADWEPKEYKVTFDKQEGTGGTDFVRAKYECPMPTKTSQGTLITLPTRTGYTFQGYYSEPNGNGTKYYNENMDSACNWNVLSEQTIFAHWKANTYIITFEYLNGIGTIEQKEVTYGKPLPYTYFTRIGYNLDGFFSKPNGQGIRYYKGGNGIGVWSIAANYTLYANWIAYSYPCNISYIAGETSFEETIQITYDQEVTLTAKEFSGYSFSKWEVESGSYPYKMETHEFTTQTITFKNFMLTDRNRGRFLIVTCWYTQDSCVAEGSQITLADGTQMAVELLTGDEELLVWNFFTGTFDTAPILFIDHDSAQVYEVINLMFSDGTAVKVISEHGFWDFDLNEYVFLRRDAAKYIGHWFNKQTTDEDGNFTYTRVQLTNVIVENGYTSAWSPVTYGHLCYYVNGMLSMPGATTGLINIFNVDTDTMKIDETKYNEDIAEYGLFTYEEFAAIYPVPEVIFEAFGGQYLKVAMGKCLIDSEMLGQLIASYAKFFG